MPASVACLYDVHGNVLALAAVLEELARHRVDSVVIGGDMAWGPEPAAAIDMVRTLPWPTHFVRGNTDREIVSGQSRTPWVQDINQWCQRQLKPQHLSFLSSLPLQVKLTVDGTGTVLFVHGSPRDDDEPIRQSTPRRDLEMMLRDVEADVVVCGHTHIAFERVFKGTRVINPGSVGLQSCAKGALWALIGREVQWFETPYDVRAEADRIQRSGMPMALEMARHLLNPPMEPPWPEGPVRSLFVP